VFLATHLPSWAKVIWLFLLFTQIFGDAPVSSHSTFTSPDAHELFAVSRNTEVDLFTHTEMKPGVSTAPDELAAPVEIFETFAISGTVVLTAIATFLFFGLTGLTVFTALAGTVVLVALVMAVGITDTATLNELNAAPLVAFATDTLDETQDVKNQSKTNNRLTTTPPADWFD